MTDPSDVSLSGETLKSVVAKFTMSAAGFVGTIVFARVLGAEGIGDFFVLMSVASIVNQLTSGFSQGLQKRASENSSSRNEIFGAAVIFPIIWAGIAGLGALVLSNQLTSYVGFARASAAFVAVVVSTGLFVSFESIITASGRIGRFAWIDTTRSILTLAAQVAFIVGGLGAAGIAFGVAGATGVTVLLLYAMISARPTLPSRRTIRSLWAYTKYSILTGYFGKIYSEFDILLIRWLLVDAVAGYYGIALRLSKPGRHIAMVVTDGMYSQISNLHSKGEPFERVVTDSLSFTSLFAVPMLVGGTLLNEELIVTVFGKDNFGAAPLLPGLLLFQMIRTQSGPLETVIRGMDRPEILTRNTIIALGVNVVLGVALTLVLQSAVGVIVATVIAEGVRYVLAGWFVKSHVPKARLFPRPLFEQVGAAVVMAAWTVVLGRAIAVNGWLSLVGIVGAGAVVYFMVLGTISRGFRITVASGLDNIYPGWRKVVGHRLNSE